MVDGGILFGLALLAGGVLPVQPWPTAVAAVGSLFLVRRRVKGWMCGAALAGMALGAWRSGTATSSFDAERAAVRDALGGPMRCAARAEVVASPVSLRRLAPTLPAAPLEGGPHARSPPADGSLVSGFTADLSRVECEGRAIPLTFRARIYGGPDDLARGDQLEVIGGLAPVQLFHNEDLTDPRPSAARRGVTASGGAEDVRVVQFGSGPFAAIDRFRAHVRRRIQATFPPEAAPMARALVLGESDLDRADNQAFRASGLAHLLAVSGTHLVLVVAGAVSALSSVLRRVTWISASWDVGRWSAALGVPFAWIYADFAGGSGSARRAAAMLSVALAARALGRRPSGPRALGLSLTGAAVVDPLVAFDLSFLLSVAAAGGLMLLQRPAAAWLVSCAERGFSGAARARWVAALSGAMATTLAATVGCAPLIAFVAPALPVGGVLANLLAVPLGELVALPVCLAHAFLGWFPAIERGAALVASGSLLLVRGIARVTEQATWLAVPVPLPSPWQYAIMSSLATACWCAQAGRRLIVVLAGLAALIVAEAAAFHDGNPSGKLRVTVLDVGQGDAAIVDFPDGQAMLVDGGGLVGSPIDTGEVVIDPVLRRRRRSQLSAVVLSHPHPDHFGGLVSSLRATSPREFWDSGQGESEGAGPVYAALLRAFRARGAAIVRPASLCGRPREFGAAVVEVLGPCPGPVPFANPNDNSLVLRISLGDRGALLVGDAEHDAEQALLRAGASLRADFLKVGHHGSRTSSSPEFVQAVAAQHAAISCGVRNRFGHPHPEATRTLAASARVYRTDRDGSIRWETDGKNVAIVVAGKERSR